MNQNKNKFPQEIVLADGQRAIVDIYELLQRADMIASNYGIGNCKTFTEFVNVVDEEDPVIINGLLYAAFERFKIMYGGKSEDRAYTGQFVERRQQKEYKATQVKNPAEFKRFLKEFGTTDEEIKEAEKRMKGKKLEDFSWITPEILMDDNFDFNAIAKRMKDSIKKSGNIKLSKDKMLSRKKIR